MDRQRNPRRTSHHRQRLRREAFLSLASLRKFGEGAMGPTPEQDARRAIDAALIAAGWVVQDRRALNLHAGPGVAVREFALTAGHGFADYLLYVDGKAAGVLEAKKAGATLTGVEPQTARYSDGLPDDVPRHVFPLPFLYQSTGVETRFTNGLDPEPASREISHVHRPETLRTWLDEPGIGGHAHIDEQAPATLKGRLRVAPPADERGMRAIQVHAVRNLEDSMASGRRRALIQMVMGAGKTVTAITSAYRLLKFGRAKRILFLVDRKNLGEQALKEFQAYRTPDDGRLFTELYNVQLLKSNKIDPVAKVVITTIQRLYSMLRGDETFDDTLEDGSLFDRAGVAPEKPVEVSYSPTLPPEFFDVVFIDECHRSIYTLWRGVVEYWDAYLTGLTATPSKQTFGFFRRNLVTEYTHEEAVADGVNVDFGVYAIRTAITEAGSNVEAGLQVGRRDRLTRAKRWTRLDEDFAYTATQLDRDVVALDQIRTVIRTFRDRVLTEIFPGREYVPKTLIFAKNDSHADDIVQTIREEFGKGNDFCQKITYRTTGAKPEDLLQLFRNSVNPRIVVTVDMIATGTDIKPLEIVMFMRTIKSRNYFEQMKGRGSRVILPTDFRQVTPDAEAKTHFMIVDCVGVTESALQESTPMDRQPSVALEKLLNQVAMGSTNPDTLSTLASRLSRLDRRLEETEQAEVRDASGGPSLSDLSAALVRALDPDAHFEAARRTLGLPDDAEPPAAAVRKAAEQLAVEAARPLAASPALRDTILRLKSESEQVIDEVSEDTLLDAGHSEAARQRARGIVDNFQAFIEQHRDDIVALQILYSRPRTSPRRLRYEDVKGLAKALREAKPPLTAEQLWRAYETLERDRVRGAGAPRIVTDVVSLVKHAVGDEPDLVPFPHRVQERFEAWIAQQEEAGRAFTDEQREWLTAIAEYVAANAEFDTEAFEYAPFVERGGVARATRVFEGELARVIEEMNEVLVG